MIIVNGKGIKGFLYDSLETAKDDLEDDEVIVTNYSDTLVIIRKEDLEKVGTVGYTKVN
ncbi:hypothetical protein [Fictibacillus terranigra]|uniref:Uncharacterized protein n=1 Tax=Fictibacillus terranigra TaxID=3058424 RepID=A0ABT8EBQ2_9BACL|nr:hypothetical protein [Fictibacillus sp. CENA-BCM004]MDN4075297.1 hypothetical protein [Fictibacillus sp. CENA-BCM004]